MIIPSGPSDLSSNATSEIIKVMINDSLQLEYDESVSNIEAVLLDTESWLHVDNRHEDVEDSDARFLFGYGGHGCSCKHHKLCLKKAKKKCCCKDKYFALEDVLYQLIIVALLGLLIFFQAMGGGRKRRRRSLQFLQTNHQGPDNQSKLARPVIDYVDDSTSTWSHPLDRVNKIMAQAESYFPEDKRPRSITR